jgi:hypothetical protein
MSFAMGKRAGKLCCGRPRLTSSTGEDARFTLRSPFARFGVQGSPNPQSAILTPEF